MKFLQENTINICRFCYPRQRRGRQRQRERARARHWRRRAWWRRWAAWRRARAGGGRACGRSPRSWCAARYPRASFLRTCGRRRCCYCKQFITLLQTKLKQELLQMQNIPKASTVSKNLQKRDPRCKCVSSHYTLAIFTNYYFSRNYIIT